MVNNLSFVNVGETGLTQDLPSGKPFDNGKRFDNGKPFDNGKSIDCTDVIKSRVVIYVTLRSTHLAFFLFTCKGR